MMMTCNNLSESSFPLPLARIPCPSHANRRHERKVFPLPHAASWVYNPPSVDGPDPNPYRPHPVRNRSKHMFEPEYSFRARTGLPEIVRNILLLG